MATVLQRTGSGAYYGKMTISFWIKRSKLGEQGIFGRREGSATANLSTCHFTGADQLLINFRDGGGTSKYYMITNRTFRDVGAWYHIVFAIDGTHATASERSKLYVNGVRETSFSLLSNPSSTGYEVNMFVGGSYNTYIGRGLRSQIDSWLTFEGCMSHFHCSTGYTYDADVFGSTDSVTGEWQINTSPTFTPGTDGFTVLKDGNTITDQSANSNNFTVYSGTLTKTEDCPSNVFCTNNSQWKQESTRYLTHTRGNTMISAGGSSTWYQTPGTLAFNKGKFYWECKFNAGTNLAQNTAGVIDVEKTTEAGQFQDATGSVFYKNEDGGETRLDGVVSTADYGLLTQNQILGVAVDMDASPPTVKYYRDGSLLATVNASSLAGKTVTPAQTTYASGEYQVNYGNGYFAETAISTAGTNASGNGIFEHDVPTGYTALSTKGLNL